MKVSFFKKGLIRNIGALYLVQIANYVVPLLLLPFLTRVLGVESYGELVTLQAVAAYGLVITDYGFQLSATRKVATMLERGESIRHTYAQITAVRVILAIFATLLMCLVLAVLPHLNLTLASGMALSILVIGNALTPLWLFQGFQHMVLVSVVLLLTRVIAAILLLLLIRSSQDVIIALWVQALSVAIPAVFALWRAARLVPSGGRPSLPGMRAELIDGWPVFQTAVFSALLTNSGALILGVVAGNEIVGGYAAVERLGKGVASMLAPVTQAIYPKISGGFARSYQDGLNILRSFSFPLLILSIFLALLVVGIAVLGGIGWLLGKEYQRFSGALLVLAPWMMLGVINNLLGIQYLTNVGQQQWYAIAFSVSSIAATILFYLLSHWWSYWGIAWGLVLGEAVLASLLWWRAREVGWRWREETQL